MKGMKKRILSLVLAVAMLASVVPSTAFAAEVGETTETVAEEQDVQENETEEVSDGEEASQGEEMEEQPEAEPAETEETETEDEETEVILETEETEAVPFVAAVDVSGDSSYGYDETPAQSVDVTITISNDGKPLLGQDGTVLSHLKVTVPYFDLAEYGLSDYYRYGTENGSGSYVDNTVVERPTLLHLYIYMMERYYMGLDEEVCGTGESDLLGYAEPTTVAYMDGTTAYTASGNVFSISGSATSLYMTKFWGHGENLMYYRNHRYPLMSSGWGATADYILLSDGDYVDLGMFSNWYFYQSGAFLSFDQEDYTVSAEDTFTVTTKATAQTAGSTGEETPITTYTGSADLALYDAKWNKVSDTEITSLGDGTYSIKAPKTAGTYYLMASDTKATTEDADKAPATAVVTVKLSGYEVTVNVAPSAANVTFYKGENADAVLEAARVTDNGIVGNYHQYVLVVPEGTYSYRAEEAGQDLGGMSFDVPFEDEIMSDGSSSGKGMTMTLVRMNMYTTNSAVKNIGDYSVRIMPGTFADAVCGAQYVDSSSRVVTPTMVVARGNALVYQMSVTLYNELAEDYAVKVMTNVTFGDTLKATQNKTFSLSAIVTHTITAPKAAKVQVFNQLKNFLVEEIKAVSSQKNSDGTVTYTFDTPGGSSLTYRVSMDGKITRAGYFSSSAENLVVTFDKNENPKTTENQMDNTALQKRIESSTMLNVNGQNDLMLDAGETFRLRMYRGAWQIINSDTANIMIEPDFHYEILSGGEHIKMTPVTDTCTGNASGNWVDITGVSAGTAIVEVSYDAILIGGEGTSYDGLYGATDPQRTSLFVIQVGGGENALSMTADGASNVWDTEYDTVYYLGETGSLTFTASLDGEVPDKVELSTDKGTSWTEASGADGSYTVNGLVGGNNILRFTKGEITAYQVVRAAKVTYTMTNLTRGGSAVLPRDQVQIVYSGIYTPIAKFSGIYNPGFGLGHKVTYTLPEGVTATASGGQYDFITTNKYVVTMPETAGDVTLTGGHVTFNVMGVADPLGGHRLLTDMGTGTNFSAVSTAHVRSVLPDLTIQVVDMPTVPLTVLVKDGEEIVADANVVLKDADGVEIAADASGIYQAALGQYTYEIRKEGYIFEYGKFDVEMADAQGKTVTITLRKMDASVWDGETLTEVTPNEDGVYELSSGAELAWFASKVNDGEGSAWNALLTEDISLGNFQWTPIGTSSNSYKGTFDGDGHQVTDLYIDSTEQYQGLFGYLQTGAVVQYLSVYGRVVSTAANVGGIAGCMHTNTTVQHCANYAEVTGLRNVGGIVGKQGISTAEVKNCCNTGDITATGSAGFAGGISGGSTAIGMQLAIENCYSIGKVEAVKYGYALAATSQKAYVLNSYYLTGAGSQTSTTGTEASEETLKGLAAVLGSAFAEDTANVNQGYPVLAKRPVHKVSIKAKNAAGAASVKNLTDYTFTVTDWETGYDYNPVVLMDGEEVDVIGSGEGTFTVEAVTGELVISQIEKTRKSFAVTVTGTAASLVSGENYAAYGLDYTFSIAEEAGYTYFVAAEVDGEEREVTFANGSYVVAGVTGPVVLTADAAEIEDWKNYTVSYELNGHGTAIESQTVKDGAMLTAPEEPSEEGFVFAGWYTDAACKTAWNFAEQAVHADVTLYAKWVVAVGEEEGALQIRELADVVYTGKAQKPAVEVYAGDALLKAGKDYTVKYVNNTNVNSTRKTGNGMGADYQAGLPAVIITGKGNYTEVISANFNILPASVADETGALADGFTLKINAQNVAGKKAVTIFKSLKYKNTMKSGVDFDAVLYQVTEDDRIALESLKVPAGESGTYELEITGKGNYTGTAVVKGITVAASKEVLLKNATITLGKNAKKVSWQPGGVTLKAAMQNGADVFTVKIGKTYLNPETDYEVSYKNNTAVGKATLTITGKGSYTGSKSVTFQIVGTALKASQVKVEGLTDKVYTGKEAVQNNLKLLYGGQELARDTYTVSYKNNVKKGTASVTFTMDPASGYTGKVTKKFKILAAELKDSMMSVMSAISSSYCAGGTTVNEKIHLVYGGVTLTEGKDYTVSYKNNSLVAAADSKTAPTIVLKGKGNFTGTLTQTFTITQKAFTDADITFEVEAMKYDPSVREYKPKVVVKDGGVVVNASQYSIKAYKNNTRAAYRSGLTAQVQIQSANDCYTNTSRWVSFNIYEKKITQKNLFVVVNEEEAVYSGTQVMPSVSVYYVEDAKVMKELNQSYKKLNALKALDVLIDMDAYVEAAKQQILEELAGSDKIVELESGTEYSVSYGQNLLAGRNKGSVTITGWKPYGGSVTVKFDISRKPLM